MKRIITLLVICAMALTFAACGEGNDKVEAIWPGSTADNDNSNGNSGGNSNGNSGVASNGDASAPELCVTLADAFAKLAEMGLSYQANHECICQEKNPPAY